MPITSTLGGNYICVATRGKVGAVYHTVYTYKTVYIDDLVPIDVTMASPLADSFTEFLDSLTEIPDPYCRIQELGKQGTKEDLAKYLAEGNSIDTLGKNNWTIVCHAVIYGNVPMIQASVECHASLSKTIEIAAHDAVAPILD